MTLPRPLAPGDRVALVAPAGPAPADQLVRAVELVTSWGLEPVTYASVTAAHPRAAYLSGDDAARAADVQDAWCDPEVAGIFCVRGGYGTVRILDLLDRVAMAEAMQAHGPTPLYGSSDVTALHEWLRESLGVSTWFTPMPATRDLLDDDTAIASLHAAVTGSGPFVYHSPSAVSVVRGEVEGTLIGGNLSLLAMTLAARSRPPVDHRDCLVLLEDVTEEAYRLDGYLQALLRAGWFDGVVGVACGSWLECGPLDEVQALVTEALEPLGVPLVWELGFGHGPGAASLPLGVRARLDAGDEPVLTVTEEAP